MPEKKLTPEEKKLTPEEKKALKEEGEKNGLSEKEIKDVENLVAITGGMSEAAKRTLIGVGSAFGGAALAALGAWALKTHQDRKDAASGMVSNKPVGAGASIIVPGPLNKDGSFGNYMDPPKPETTGTTTDDAQTTH